jgi:hypothetical protein
MPGLNKRIDGNSAPNYYDGAINQRIGVEERRGGQQWGEVCDLVAGSALDFEPTSLPPLPSQLHNDPSRRESPI